MLVSLADGLSWLVWSPESVEDDGVGDDVLDGPDVDIVRVGEGVKSPEKDGREETVVEGTPCLVQFPV